MRLDQLLCHAGAAVSRAAAKDAVRAGRVSVSGLIARESGMAVDPDSQPVALDGRILTYKRWHYLMLHKPEGRVTAARDGRAETVMDLLPPFYRVRGCMPVGRLDKDAEGLLLFTNHGALAHRLLSPARGVIKRYLAEVDGPLSKEDTDAFGAGLRLGDMTALPAALEVLSSGGRFSRAICGVCEGKFHQVKRMFAARGRTVTYLKRLSVGPLELDGELTPGSYRELTPGEIAALYSAAGLAAPGVSGC